MEEQHEFQARGVLDLKKENTEAVLKRYGFSGRFRSFLRRGHSKFQNKPSLIYVALDPTDNSFKIGRTIRPYERYSCLKSQFPGIRLIALYEGKHNDEKILHELFRNKSLGNEWFALNESDLVSIEEYFFPAEEGPWV